MKTKQYTKRQNNKVRHFTSVELTERDDKPLLLSASSSKENLEKTLERIKDGSINFIGQYAKSRKIEAMDYLERTLREQYESDISSR